MKVVLIKGLCTMQDDTAVKSLAFEARKSHDGLLLNPARAESPEGKYIDIVAVYCYSILLS